jgi:hypothetical protein
MAMLPNVFEIEEFHLPADGDDFYPAITRAQQVQRIATGRVTPLYAGGWTIVFGAREYRFLRPIELFRCMHLRGSGGADQPGTRFVFVNQTPGLVIHHGGSTTRTYDEPAFLDETQWQAAPGYAIPPKMVPPVDDPAIPSGAGSVIENIDFVGSITPEVDFPPDLPYVNGGSFLGPQDSYALFFDRHPSRVTNFVDHGVLVDPFESAFKPDPRSHGMVAYGRFTLRHCVVRSFAGHGIYIYGNTANAIADNWYVDTVMVRGNANNGLHIFGTDSHLGLALNLQALANRLWGVADLSYSGNQFIGGQASNNHFGGFLRPRSVRVLEDQDNPSDTPLPGITMLRGFYGEDNNAKVPAGGGFAPTYAGQFLSFNRFVSAYNLLEHCQLETFLVELVGGVITPPAAPAQGIDTGYEDTGCNTTNLEGEFIPSFNTGIRLQDRLSLVALGSKDHTVWVRSMSRAAAASPINRAMPSFGQPVQPLPEVVFFTDPVAGGYVGSVYCLVRKEADGSEIWEHRPFGKIEV